MGGRDKLLRGRAAGSNPANRYDRQRIDPFDDGWQADERDTLRTLVSVDHARKAISYNDSPDIPFDRSVNPYRGCEHGCIYCYARPTHAWLDLSPGLDFESRLFARPDLPRLLSEELGQPGYTPAPIAISGVTDAYQPIEREWRLTRQVLETLAGARHPALLITKSALVERDIDILQDMARDALVEVSISLTTLDRRLARTLEPRAAAPARRLQTISELAASGIPVKVMLAPLIPVLNESELETLLGAARDAGANSAAYVLLRLPLEVAPLFRDWLQQHEPGQAARIMSHVQESRLGRDNDSRFGHRIHGNGHYAELLRQRFELAVRRLGLDVENRLRCDLFRAPSADGQLTLF
ncbi:MAG: PA0069 family radical SAM protein [Gammaproteobacteria bacterium]|nr:PA0069 family radical SAM protein [Gammaproteobacteria bacterium]